MANGSVLSKSGPSLTHNTLNPYSNKGIRRSQYKIARPFRHLAVYGETMKTTRAVAKAFCVKSEPELPSSIERNKPPSAGHYVSAGRVRYDRIAL